MLDFAEFLFDPSNFFEASRKEKIILNCLWYLCYTPHWSRDSVSPVCGIFKFSADRGRKNDYTVYFTLYTVHYTDTELQKEQICLVA